MLVAREPQLLKREWLQACDSFLRATLAHVRYLRSNGRLAGPDSEQDIAELEDLQLQVRQRLEHWRVEAEHSGTTLRLPQDPGRRLALAGRRELRLYRDAVCQDAKRLRASSSALVRQCREARRLRALDGSVGPSG